MKITRCLIIVFILCGNMTLVAQNEQSEIKRKQIVQHFISGYNEQNYSKMKKNWFMLAKILPLKKGLKNQLEPHYKKYGKAEIKDIVLKGNSARIHLKYPKDSTKKNILVMHFNSNNKIEGVGFVPPTFKYPKILTNELENREQVSYKIEQIVTNAALNDNFNGNVLVLEDEKIVYKKSFGFSDFEKKTPLNDSSVFYLASCSKQFTAMAIMILYEQGKLNLTDTLQKFIPELPYKGITIEHLLRHTSGLPDYMELMDKHWDKSKKADNYDVIKMLVQHKPKIYFYPEELFWYSNTGYTLLAVIVEKCSAMTFNDFVRKNIFSPINMKSTFIGGASIEEGRKTPNWAYGHIFSKKENKYVFPETIKGSNQFYLDPVVGDGNVNTSLTDLIKWENAIYEYKLIEKETLEKMYSSYQLKSGKNGNYGFGYFLSGDENEEKIVWHSGGWTGYHTFMLRFKDHKKSVIILSNNEYTDFMELADEILQLVLGEK